MGIRSIVLSGLFALTVSGVVSAHPHVWVDVASRVVVQSGVLEGLEVEMTLDDVYSSLVLEDSAPGVRTLDAKAIETIRKTYFKDLAYFDYLTQLSLGNKKVKVPEPQQFSAVLGSDGRVTYRFFLPLKLSLTPNVVFSAAFYDESYYIDVGFVPKTPVTLKASGSGTATWNLKKASGANDQNWVPPAAFEVRWKP